LKETYSLWAISYLPIFAVYVAVVGLFVIGAYLLWELIAMFIFLSIEDFLLL
jgi:hypothetical protein